MRGRQLAWLLIVGPVTLVLAIVLPAVTDPGLYPWVLGLAPALLGGGAGLIVVLSVYAGYPMPDQQANPFAAGGNPGIARVLLQLAIAMLLAVVALPVIAWSAPARACRPCSGSRCRWGIGVGRAVLVVVGRLAQRRLVARGPELLAEVGKQV